MNVGVKVKVKIKVKMKTYGWMKLEDFLSIWQRRLILYNQSFPASTWDRAVNFITHSINKMCPYCDLCMGTATYHVKCKPYYVVYPGRVMKRHCYKKGIKRN